MKKKKLMFLIIVCMMMFFVFGCSNEIDEKPTDVLASVTQYNNDTISYRLSYKSDDRGNLTEEWIHYPEENKKERGILRYKWEYDKRNNKILEIEYDYTFGNSITRYEYDKDGKLIKEVFLHADIDEDGHEKNIEERGWIDIEYDEEERIIKKTKFNSYGELDHWLEYEYEHNEEVNMRKEIRFYPGSFNGTVLHIWGYDSSGNVLSQINYEYEDTFSWYEYYYDDNGNKINEIFFDKYGERMYYTDYVYNDKEKLIKETTYIFGGTVTREYEYK